MTDLARYSRDKNGNLYIPRPKRPAMEPGERRYWNRCVDLYEELVAVTVIEDRGKWIVVEAADGKHRIRPHNCMTYNQAVTRGYHPEEA